MSTKRALVAGLALSACLVPVAATAANASTAVPTHHHGGPIASNVASWGETNLGFIRFTNNTNVCVNVYRTGGSGPETKSIAPGETQTMNGGHGSQIRFDVYKRDAPEPTLLASYTEFQNEGQQFRLAITDPDTGQKVTANAAEMSKKASTVTGWKTTTINPTRDNRRQWSDMNIAIAGTYPGL